MNHYPKLFEPGKIAHLSIKNRIVMTAMGVCLSGADGQASPEIIKYYEARAKGGVGLIITEIARIDDSEGIGMPYLQKQFAARVQMSSLAVSRYIAA